ncbi:MAG: SDR family NAD(P)-dependent oxidoreductase [Opitutales bacterium]|nr:SDR family NAD(P)-dependent oxidoreductase [Opitutales bacterium]
MNIDNPKNAIKSNFKENRKTLKVLENLSQSYSAVILTGGSSGIGRSFLELVYRLPKNILICNISRTKSEKFFERGNVFDFQCDLSCLDKIDCAFVEIRNLIEKNLQSAENPAKNRKILLINNSGFGAYGPFPEPNLAHNANMIDVNVRALTYLCGKFMPLIRANGGGIINVASTAAWQPCPYLSVYGATKSYVMNFSLALDYEMRKFGAACLCLCPGPTTSNFFRRAGFDKRPLKSNFGHEPEQVALAALFAFCKRKNLKVVGFLNSVLTFANYLIPRSLMGKIAGAILARVRQ